MATGDTTDIRHRLRSLIPSNWFPRESTILDAILTGASTAYSWIYSLIGYVTAQTRLLTLKDAFLDLFANDFFGFNGLQRKSNESDASYAPRIQQQIFQEKATRAGIQEALSELTGEQPNIIEPWNPGDCGGYDMPTSCGYDVHGFLGDPFLKYTFFVQAFIPFGPGIPNASGYDDIGGYDAGWLEYSDPAQLQGPVTATQIYQLVNNTRAAGVTAWVQVNAGVNSVPVMVTIPVTPPPSAGGGILDFSVPADSSLLGILL
jgi:hypothetical protein